MIAEDEVTMPIRVLTARHLMWIVWPAFLVAAAAELVFFSVFDPLDLHFFGAPLEMSRQAIYTMGFFGFWAVGVASSALTLFLEQPAHDAAAADAEMPADDPRR